MAKGGRTETVRQETIGDPFVREQMANLFNLGQEFFGQGFQPFTGQRFAGFTDDQLAGFDAVRALQGSGSGFLNDARGLLGGIGNLSAQQVRADQVRAGQFQDRDINDFLNPVTDTLVDRALGDIDRSNQLAPRS